MSFKGKIGVYVARDFHFWVETSSREEFERARHYDVTAPGQFALGAGALQFTIPNNKILGIETRIVEDQKLEVVKS